VNPNGDHDRSGPEAPGSMIRGLRWLLIRNGLSENEADVAIERLRTEFSSTSDAEQFQKFCENLTSALAKQASPKVSRQSLRNRLKPWVQNIGSNIIVGGLTVAGTKILSSDQPPSLAAPVSPSRVVRSAGVGWVFHARSPDAPIEAASSGFILQSEQDILNGHRTGTCVIRVSHSKKWETRYLFFGHGTARKGEFVKQGQVIGRLSRGLLLYQLRRDGLPVDDPQYVDAEKSDTPTPDEARLVIRAVGIWKH
jgi:murein DD-endopeptidase MepM/ murein hydrolase activator NlpD